MHVKYLSKVFILGLFYLSQTHTISAQPCTPDNSVKTPGIYVSGNKVDTVWIGESYTETATYFSIKDTTITVTISPFPTATVNAAVDSVSINNWSSYAALNIPYGLNASCNTSKCVFPGNSKNCFKISGLVTDINDTGEYQVILNVNYYLKINASPFNGVKYTLKTDIKPFTLIVRKRASANITNAHIESHLKVFPNPSSTGFYLSGMGGLNNTKLSISDVSGKMISGYESEFKNGNLYFGNDLKPGIYFVSIETSKSTKSTLKILKH